MILPVIIDLSRCWYLSRLTIFLLKACLENRRSIWWTCSLADGRLLRRTLGVSILSRSRNGVLTLSLSYKLMGRKPLYITTGRGVTDPLTGAGFSVTHICFVKPADYIISRFEKGDNLVGGSWHKVIITRYSLYCELRLIIAHIPWFGAHRCISRLKISFNVNSSFTPHNTTPHPTILTKPC